MNNKIYFQIIKEDTKMKKITLSIFLMLGIIMSLPQDLSAEKQLTALQILEKVDDVINAPKDQDLKIKLILVDKNGKEKIREMSMLQKGSDKRMVKFLSPANQKGIAFLSLPNDIMYLYLPAFKKVRRIASHVKNTKFAGTDFTYEDMEAIRYSEKYNPELMKKENDSYVVKTDYSKLIIWIRSDNFYPFKIEYYNKNRILYKIMLREKIEKVNDYWISKESEMEDLKTKHKTKMCIVNVKFDSGIPEKKFSKRYLNR
jgi:outer membrane lipoprotein-sorting protein